jgi:hypothetical protein
MAMTEEPLPEQTFFADPAIDRVLGVAMTLAADVWVLRDRLRALEALLAARGQLESGALDAYVPSAEEAEAIAKERDAFVAALMENLLGRQVSKGAPSDLVAKLASKR